MRTPKLFIAFALALLAAVPVSAGAQLQPKQPPPPKAPPGVQGGGMDATVKWMVRVHPRGTLFRILTARKVPADGHVEVTCSGRGCAFSSRTLEPTEGEVEMAKLFKHRLLRKGARVEVRALDADGAGKIVSYRVRKLRLPTVKVLCLPPGAQEPSACS